MTPLSLLVAVVWIAASLLIAVFAMLGEDAQFRLYYSNALQTLLPLAAAMLCYQTMFAFPSGSPLRKVWGLIGSGVLAWGIGATLFAAYPIFNNGAETPYPYYSDIGYLLTGPLMIIALLTFKDATGLVSPAWGKWLSGILLLGLVAIALRINWDGLLGEGIILPLVSTGYVLFDPVLLAVTVLTASAFGGGVVGRAWWCVVGGILLYYIANQAYNYFIFIKEYATGSPVDIGWLLGFGLIAMAAVMTRNLLEEG